MSREISLKIPSVQTIILIVLLIGAFTSIVWVSVATNLEMPQPSAAPQPSSSQTQEGPAAWLSAWSTFWGAMAAGIGAIGTAGALWLGAIVYRRQASDQHRAQASAVTVAITPSRAGDRQVLQFEIRNDSLLPIYNVILVASDNSVEVNQDFRHVIPTVDAMSFEFRIEGVASSYGLYTDSAGARWRRFFNGDLEEVKQPDK